MSLLRKAVAAAVALSLLGGVSGAGASEKDKLTIWINGDKGHKGLAEVGKRFTKETGIPVTVEHPDALTDKFMQAASTKGGPDILFWAHDRLGEWASSGLVIPVDVPKALKEDVQEKAWDAFTHDGKVWGYPIALEALALIYNKALVKEAPKSFKDIAAMKGKLGDGVSPIMWPYDTPYFSWPVLAAHGAEAYVREDGKYNVSKTTIAGESAVKGANLIRDLIKNDVMPKGVTYSVMEAAMMNGKAAMMINGPWSWENLRKNKIDYAVAPLPTVSGESAKAFVGVLGAMISSASKNKDLAKEFLESYVMKPEGLREIDKDVPIGVPASSAFYEELKTKPEIAATMENVKQGVLMPNIPEMAKFWAALEAALGNISGGRQEPAEALKAAEQRMLTSK